MFHTNFVGRSTTKGMAVGASVFLLLILMTVAATGTAAAQSAPGCSGISYNGDGTTSNPYEVSNVDQLQCINEQGLDANYVQVSDIDASETSSWNSGEGFVPIANDTDDSSANFQGTKFTGTFDGSGNTISGLYIDRGSTVGLFGFVGSGGRIEKVGVENVDITGNVDVGGLVGTNGGTITESYATGSVSGDGFNVGGLVGDGRLGIVKKSYATGDVSGDSNVGGLVGNGGTVEKSYATGSVSGGRNVGGLVGQGVSLTVTGSYYDTETTGQSSSEGGTGLTTSEMIGSAATSNMDGFDFTSAWETVTGPDDYPILAWQTEDGGGGDPPDADLVSINIPDTAQPDGDFDFTVEMVDSGVGEVAVESSDFDVSLSVVDDAGDSIGGQTDTSVEFIDLDEETSTYTLNVDVTGGSEGDTGTITAATGGNIDSSGVDDQTSTTFSLETTTESPVEDVSDDLWAAVTQDDGSEGLSLADLGNAIQQYQANPGNADVDGVDIGLSDLGSLIQYYRTEVV